MSNANINVKYKIFGCLFFKDRINFNFKLKKSFRCVYIFFQYYSIKEDSFASFSYDTLRDQGINTPVEINNQEFSDIISIDDIPPMQFCLKKIANVTIFNNTYEFDISEVNGEESFFTAFNMKHFYFLINCCDVFGASASKMNGKLISSFSSSLSESSTFSLI